MQAPTTPLQVLCAAQAGAQAISEAAGQAGQAAISPVFGEDPCKLFQGKLVVISGVQGMCHNRYAMRPVSCSSVYDGAVMY